MYRRSSRAALMGAVIGFGVGMLMVFLDWFAPRIWMPLVTILSVLNAPSSAFGWVFAVLPPLGGDQPTVWLFESCMAILVQWTAIGYALGRWRARRRRRD